MRRGRGFYDLDGVGRRCARMPYAFATTSPRLVKTNEAPIRDVASSCQPEKKISCKVRLVVTLIIGDLDIAGKICLLTYGIYLPVKNDGRLRKTVNSSYWQE